MYVLSYRIRDFQHIAKRVERQWGTRGCRDYLHELTVEDRSRPPRKGFPLDVLDALVDLMYLHDEFYPNYVPTVYNWSSPSVEYEQTT